MSHPGKLWAGSAFSLLFTTWTGMAAATVLLVSFASVVSAGRAQAEQARMDLTALDDLTWRCKRLQDKQLSDECLQRLVPMSRPVATLVTQK